VLGYLLGLGLKVGLEGIGLEYIYIRVMVDFMVGVCLGYLSGLGLALGLGLGLWFRGRAVIVRVTVIATY
jgi:hypothetical protein